jgi:hypothetical protein
MSSTARAAAEGHGRPKLRQQRRQNDHLSTALCREAAAPAAAVRRDGAEPRAKAAFAAVGGWPRAFDRQQGPLVAAFRECALACLQPLHLLTPRRENFHGVHARARHGQRWVVDSPAHRIVAAAAASLREEAPLACAPSATLAAVMAPDMPWSITGEAASAAGDGLKLGEARSRDRGVRAACGSGWLWAIIHFRESGQRPLARCRPRSFSRFRSFRIFSHAFSPLP